MLKTPRKWQLFLKPVVNFLIQPSIAFRTWRDSLRTVNNNSKTYLLFVFFPSFFFFFFSLFFFYLTQSRNCSVLCVILFNPWISEIFPWPRLHSHLAVELPPRPPDANTPSPGGMLQLRLLPYSLLSSVGTSAAAPAWAHHPTAAEPSGNAAVPVSRSPADRPWQWFPSESSSHESSNIQTFRFLKQTKSNGPTSVSHTMGPCRVK